MPSELASVAGGLEQFGRDLLALRGIGAEIAIEASQEIEHAIDSEFALGSDPYGEPWAPLAASTIKRGRHDPPLTDTGDMRASVSVTVLTSEIVASVDDPASYHQSGDARLPSRPILPDERGMPPAWDAAIVDAAERVIRRRAGPDTAIEVE